MLSTRNSSILAMYVLLERCSTGVACQQGTLTTPDTWLRPLCGGLHVLWLLRPVSPTQHRFNDLPKLTFTELRGFHRAFATGVACQQGALTLPDTWFRPPLWDLLVLQLLTRFLELAMSLLDFSPRILLGTFSILLYKLEAQGPCTGHRSTIYNLALSLFLWKI